MCRKRDGDRVGVPGRERCLPVRRGAGQERDDGGRGQRGEEDQVVAQRAEERLVRQHHLRGQRHHQDDGDRPYVPVAGPLADLADDREQHPQQLVLPGGGGDGDGGAAGDRYGEQQLSVAGVAHGAARRENGDGGAEEQEEGDLQRAGEPQAEQGAVQGLVGQVVGAAAEADAGHVVDPVGVRVARHRRPGEHRAGGERGARRAAWPGAGR